MADAKTKYDYEIEEFEKAFYDKRSLNIVLYGTGRMTATLLAGLRGFHIVGILDRDPEMIGKQMYGKMVLDRKEAEEKADLIVINTSESYWNTIYQRIFEWNLPVYYRNGKQAGLIDESAQEVDWSKEYQDLKKKTEEYEVVSFDIFDTLVMRKIYLPVDIFYIVDGKLQDKHQKADGFVEWRKAAAGLLENPTIDDIYKKVQELSGWDDEQIINAKSLEIETEKYFLTPRKDLVKLYQDICRQKEVFLISDMYYPKKILQEILGFIGIESSVDHILVSCDIKRTKEDGTLWEYYSQKLLKGRKALHIGDEECADGRQPLAFGIDSWQIWSPAFLLQHSSIKSIVPHAKSLHASIAIGLIEAKLFNSPFSLRKTKGKIAFQGNAEAGYCLLGDLVYEFCCWLFEQTQKDQVEQLVFFAREGYLLTQLFDYYCSILGDAKRPKNIYLEISRRFVLAASVKDIQDIREVAQFPYVGSVVDFLKSRFGINVTNEELEKVEWAIQSEANEQWLELYSDKILQEAEREKKNYMDYLETLGLDSDFAIVDSQLYGSTQYYLGKLLDRKLSGYYFCACLQQTNKYFAYNNMKGCFSGTEGKDGKESNVYKQAPFVEAFFTAPNGMFECIEDDGSKRYARKMKNQEEFDIRLEMMEGIREFIKDMLEIQKNQMLAYHIRDTDFADRLFGTFMNQGFVESEEMRRSFWYDNLLAGNREMPVWE